MDDCGWKLMKVDEGGLKWMKWMKVDENEWKMDENVWKLMKNGWKWMKMDESGWKWMQAPYPVESTICGTFHDLLGRNTCVHKATRSSRGGSCKCTSPCWPESCVEIYVRSHRRQILLSPRKEETLQSSFHMEGRATSPWLGLVWEAILALWSCWCKLFPCFHLDCKTCLHII